MQRKEPTMPEEVAQSVDPVLVRRLWQPVDRPGVIDPGPSCAMLARHQRMVTGLPLAELVSRHTGSTSDLGATVPIVYALPSQAPPLPDSRFSGAQLNAAVSSPIVPARLAQPAVGPARSTQWVPERSSELDSSRAQSGSGSTPTISPGDVAGSPAAIAVPPADNAVSSTQTAVLSTDNVPSTDNVVPVVPPSLPSDSLSVGRLPLDRHTSEPGSPDSRSPNTGIVPTDARQIVVGPGQPTIDSAQVVIGPGRAAIGSPQLRVGSARSAPAQVVPDSPPLPSVSRAAVSTAESAALSIVRPHVAAPPLDRLARELYPPGRRLPGAETIDPGPAGPGPQQPRTPADSQRVLPAGVIPAGLGGASRSVRADRSGTPLVVARPVATVAHSDVRPGEPLLLVDLETATARAVRNRPGSAEQQESAGGHVAGVGRAAGAPRSADRGVQDRGVQDRGVQARRPAAAPMDVERIVDAVHRRFVRRLAIEAERRTVR
ncbi:MAG: hypothetical protein ACRDTG_31825 [Pseudonocardiaceae bacterium]